VPRNAGIIGPLAVATSFIAGGVWGLAGQQHNAGTGTWPDPSGGYSARYWKFTSISAALGGSKLQVSEMQFAGQLQNDVGTATVTNSVGTDASYWRDEVFNAWSDSIGPPIPTWMLFDFGSDLVVRYIRQWKGDANDRQIDTCTISYSSDDSSYTSLGSLSIPQSSGGNSTPGNWLDLTP
jgi:hypothetical protein